MAFVTPALLAIVGSVAITACTSPLPGRPGGEAPGVTDPAVVAHRGASHDAPEETAPAYLLARDLGADYLELDLQRTADGVLIAFHDDDASRTTDVAEIFPGRENDPLGSFTWDELQQLDAGSWFNADPARVDRARSSFDGLRILSLEKVLDIADAGDLRPGLYIETKRAEQYPGIERELADLLERRGWDARSRLVVQTFERDSLELLRYHLPDTPAVLLLWLGEGYLPDDSPEAYAEWVDFAASLGATGIGPDHANLTESWAVELIHAREMIVHPYTVDDVESFATLSERGVDGFFTNRPELLLAHYGRPARASPDEILDRHGYRR